MDRQGNICVLFGKMSFDAGKLIENANVILNAIRAERPSAAKGTYIRTIIDDLGELLSPDIILHALGTRLGVELEGDHTAPANREDLERNLPQSNKAENADMRGAYAVSGRGGIAHEPAVDKPRRRGGKQMKTYGEEDL